MKKILLGLVALLCCSNICNAKIANESAALGGLTVGLPLTTVEEIYGTPDTVDQYNNMTYGNGSVKICTNFKRRNSIDRIYVTANNGFATPEGIHVGSTLNEMLNVYGNPDRSMKGLCAYIAYNDATIFVRHNGSKITALELHPFFS